MPPKIQKIKNILCKYGLDSVMGTNKDHPHYKPEPIFDPNTFQYYRSKEYLSSSLCDVDEVYGFSRFVVLNKETGLRFEYSRYDSGEDAEYKLDRIFIILPGTGQLIVNDVDFTKKTVFTEQGKFPFTKLKKKI